MESVESKLIEIINRNGSSIAYAQDKHKPDAMRMLISKGYRLLFAPEIIDCKLRFYDQLLRIKDIKDSQSKKDEVEKLMNIRDLYELDFTSVSIHILTRENNRGVHFYMHRPHLFCNPDTLEKSLTYRDMIYYPEDILYALIQSTEGIWKMSDAAFDGHSQGAIPYDKDNDPVAKVINHPQTIPCCDGLERARNYIKWNIEGLSQVSHWYKRGNPDKPLAWFIQLGCSYLNTFEAENGPLEAGRFLGIKKT
jgi:hypothetical protein